MKKFLVTLSLTSAFSIPHAFSQKEANIWYFGKKAGVSFASGAPVALTGSQLSTDEGCSVISNKEGKMLFYTDGISVWNTEHKLMPHGTGLKGDPSSTQSGVAIANPKSPDMFYLFTIAATGQEAGIEYSLVDMKLENGLGDVVEAEKNVKLHSPVTEKMTAVTHRNGKDVWVITHLWKSNEFLSYLVTAEGVSKTPVSSKIGAVHQGGILNTQGYMKSNPDGSNLALALEESDTIEIFDFDNATGLVSQPISIKAKSKSYVYGVEFSANGSILYYSAAGVGEIYQINLQAGSVEAIQNSTTLIGTTPGKQWVGALQLANDGKIYFPIYNTNFLGVIEKPNTVGLECGYKNDVVNLGEGISTLGLPTFFQSFFKQDETVKDVAYFNEKTVTVGKTFVMKNINFDFAKYTLQPSSFVELKKIVLILQQNPTYKIEISGHTDNIGNKSSNILLSQNRAKAVMDYLISQKIAAERITFSGYGSSKPVANNETEEGRATNRRVEFILNK